MFTSREIHDVINVKDTASSLVLNCDFTRGHETSVQDGVSSLDSSILPLVISPNPLSSDNVISCHNFPVSTINSSIHSSISDASVIQTDTDLEHIHPVFITPPTKAGRRVKVFTECIDGSCSCRPLLEGVPYQLLPCRFAALMFNASGVMFDDSYWPLFNHIVDGFPVVDEFVSPYVCDNYKSALEPEAAKKMTKIVLSELSEGMVSQVFSLPTCIHALGAVPKPDGNIRPITDCSKPVDVSVNYHCASLVLPFKFMNIKDVVAMLQPGEFMAVVDIKSAYRAVIILPEHRQYMGFHWTLDGEKRMFQDNRLCFGLRTGPCNFNMISCFLADVLRQRQHIRLVNYLDDLLCIGSSFEACQDAQNSVISLLRFVGFYISYSKLQPPAQITKYLGVIVDSCAMELRLPLEKLVKLKQVLLDVSGKRSISRKALESLTGVLSHCATVIRGGRLFCRRLYDLYKVMISKNLSTIYIPLEARKDIEWWSRFSEFFNGKSAIRNREFPDFMYSDASRRGWGVYLGTKWFAGTWDDTVVLQVNTDCNHILSPPIDRSLDVNNINELELWPVFIGIQNWAHLLSHSTLVLYSDNTQVVSLLSNYVSANKNCMCLLRELFWILVSHDIQLEPRYISTTDNLVADALSRLAYDDIAAKNSSILQDSRLCCSDELLSFVRRLGDDSSKESSTY